MTRLFTGHPTENDTAAMADSPREYSAGPAIGGAPVTYDAFISYSHARDKPIATALQSVVQKLGKAWYRRRALRLFRDDTSLSATPHLWPSIEQALSQSRFLILLASPEAAASRWVGQEIGHWLNHKSADTVLIALTEGELDWDQEAGDFRWSEATPLPTALKNRFATEPRWIDLRPYRDRSAPRGIEFMGLGADFAAAIQGIPKEDLLSQEVRQQRRAMTLAWTAVTALVALLVAAGWLWQVAEAERAVAEDRTTEAQLQRNEAQIQRDKARTQLLAMQARRAVAEATSPKDIELAGALALEGIEIARKSNRPAELDTIEAARSALIGLPLKVLSHGSLVWCLAVLPDGRLASGGEDGTIKLWPKEGTGEPSVLSHGRPIRSLAVLADGRLASGGSDGKIKLWPKMGTGEPVVLSHGSPVYSLAVLADGRLASGGSDFRIKLWPKEGTGDPVILSHGSPVRSLVVLADGRLASGGDDGQIKLWPQEGTGEPVVLSSGGPVGSLAVLADGQLASASGLDGKIKRWPKEGTGELLLLSHGSWVGSLAVLADGRLASGGSDGKIKLWPLSHGSPGRSSAVVAVVADERSGEPVVLSHGSGVQSLAVLADGRLASAGNGGEIKLWPKEGTGEPVVLSHGGQVTSLVVLADGWLASGGDDGQIKLWPQEGAGEPMVLSHGSPVRSLVVLPDGRLASGGGDGTIKIWPKEGAGEPMVLLHGSRVLSLAVISGGRLASAGSDGTIKLWRVGEQQLIAALCLRAGRNLTKDEWARYIGLDTAWQPSCRERPSNWRTPAP